MDSLHLDILQYLLQYTWTNADYLNIAVVCKRWLRCYIICRDTLTPSDQRMVCTTNERISTTRLHLTVHRVTSIIVEHQDTDIRVYPGLAQITSHYIPNYNDDSSNVNAFLCLCVDKYAVLNDGIANAWMNVALKLSSAGFATTIARDILETIRFLQEESIRTNTVNPLTRGQIDFWYWCEKFLVDTSVDKKSLKTFCRLIPRFKITTYPAIEKLKMLATMVIDLRPSTLDEDDVRNLVVLLYNAGATDVVKLLNSTRGIPDECLDHRLVLIDLSHHQRVATRRPSKRIELFCKKIVDCVNGYSGVAGNNNSITAKEAEIARAINQTCPNLALFDDLSFERRWQVGIASAIDLVRHGRGVDHLMAFISMAKPTHRSVDTPTTPINIIPLLVHGLMASNNKSSLMLDAMRLDMSYDERDYYASPYYFQFSDIRGLITNHKIALRPQDIIDYKLMFYLAASKDISLGNWGSFIFATAKKLKLRLFTDAEMQLVTMWNLERVFNHNFTMDDAAVMFDDVMQMHERECHDCCGTMPGLVLLAVYIMACKIRGKNPLPSLELYDATVCPQCSVKVHVLYRQLGWHVNKRRHGSIDAEYDFEYTRIKRLHT